MATTAAVTGSVFDPSLGRPQVPKSELDPDAFLQLLVAQLRYQDPLKTVDQTAFMQQLATMSSMQQQFSLNAQMGALVNQERLAQAMGLLGRTVQGTDNNGNAVGGTVDAVKVIGGAPYLQVGAALVAFDQVSTVR